MGIAQHIRKCMLDLRWTSIHFANESIKLWDACKGEKENLMVPKIENMPEDSAVGE